MSGILLDTCAAIWLAEGDDLTKTAQSALSELLDNGGTIRLSAITAWEVGQLSARGRIALRQPPLAWFQELARLDGLAFLALDPEVLVASSYLPGEPPRDPADRILAATARAFGFRLMTRDRLLLDYAAAGHIDAIAC